MTEPMPVRLITMVWGDAYVDNLLSLTLPAILAPGNLPSLASRFPCDLTIVTETRLFERIRQSDAGRRIEALCQLRLVALDDLVEFPDGYGLALTYALHRGFDDLGPAMCETNLIFFNADFIIADGGLEAVARRIDQGERLIFAPSYCVISENTVPVLQSRFQPESGALVMAKREMAALALSTLHPTVLAKTINRQFYRMHVTDQLYWEVDGQTLLGHQLPIAIVCMRPQQVYTDPICFWDFSTISMACPTAKRCVMGDSDEFLMIELRRKETFHELMSIGKLTPNLVAEGLGAYMTPDQFEMGHFPLTLHSGDLSPKVEEDRAKLRQFVDQVYALLPATPKSPHDHPFWVGQAEQYAAARRRRNEAAQASLYHRELMAAAASTAVPPKAFAARPGTALNETGHTRHVGLARRIFNKLFGTMPRLTMRHPLWDDFRFAVQASDEALEGIDAPNSLLVSARDTPLSRLVEWRQGHYTRLTPLAMLADNIPTEAGQFDLAILDLDWMETNEFNRLFGCLWHRVKPGGRVVLFHQSPVIRTLDRRYAILTFQGIIPRSFSSTLFLSGSTETAKLIDSFRAKQEQIAQSRGNELDMLLHLLTSYLRTKAANQQVAKRDPHTLGDLCTALTLVIPKD